MRIATLLATASLAVLGLSTTASAEDDGGWYLRGNLGYGSHTDTDLIDGAGNSGDVESEGNVAGSLGFGYDYGNNWRVELDGDSLWTDMGAIGQTAGTSAKLRTTSAMLNVIYDFEDFNRWEPYLGAGLGIVSTKLDAFDISDASRVSDKDSGLGWQLLAGLGYDISENLKWDTHYTYRDVSDDLSYVGTNTSGAISVDASGVGSHSLLTGFRYLFGQKAAKPMPVVSRPVQQVSQYQCWDGAIVTDYNGCASKPVTQSVQQYRCWDGEVVTDINGCKTQTVTREVTRQRAVISERGNDVTALCGNKNRQEIIYYEFNKGQSAETRSTVGRILDVGQYCNVENIRVVGHTDSTGDASYNLSLSKRRAKDARDELVRQGIDGNRITSEGKGESELAIQSGDGVMEQLNRRTEVLISLGSIGVIN